MVNYSYFPIPELDDSSFIFTLTLIMCTFTLLIIPLAVRKTRRNDDSQLPPPPPGPPRLPLLGNLHQLIGGGGALPHHTLSKLSEKYGPVMRLHLGEWFAVVISSSEAAREVLRTKEASFPQRPRVASVEMLSYDNSGIFAAPNGDYWRRVRRICVSELMSVRRVSSFRSIREEEARRLVAAISSSSSKTSSMHDYFLCRTILDPPQTVNLSQLMFSATMGVTSRAMFGTSYRDGGEFLMLLQRMIMIVGGFKLADLYPNIKFLCHVTGQQAELRRLHGGMDRILDDIVNQHVIRAVNGRTEEDMLDVLIRLQGSDEVDSKLTADQIKAVTLDVFAAGSETAATTMEWTMAELMNNPTVMEKVQTELREAFKGSSIVEEADLHRHDLTYFRATVKEALRLHPPGPFLLRESIEACEVGGYRIPRDAKIVINAYALGRDPEVWSDPLCFKPERFVGSTVDFRSPNFEFVPFGGGKRVCPGISFATANVELVLAQMLYHFDWSLPEGMKDGGLDMSETIGATARKKENLHLVPTVSIAFSTC